MSLDQRIRDELQRDGDRITPDVERNLGAVEARARRRTSFGGTTLLAAAFVIAAAILIGVQKPSPSIGGPSANPAASNAASPPGSPAASGAPAYDAIAGTYRATIDPANPAASAAHLGGEWTMRLLPDGEMLLSPPATYGSIAPTGIAFTLIGDRFRTNLFYNDVCSSVGTYTWSIQGGQLTFAPVDESCGVRQTLLSTVSWQSQP